MNANFNFEHFVAKAEAFRQNADKIQNAVAILSEFVANDNDTDDAPPPVAPIVAEIVAEVVPVEPVAINAPARVYKGKADAAIIDALNADYQCARRIHEGVVAAGVKVSRAAVYQRMPILARLYPDLIEQNGEAKEWRLKSAEDAPTDEPASKSAATAKQKAKPRAVPKRSTQASNDNPILAANDILEPLALNTLHHGDCLELMKAIPDQSVDLVLCDPPYGTCGARSKSGRDIDIRIDLQALWKEYRRIIKPTGNILLFGSQPFSTDLANAARDWFKYSNIWRKDKPTGADHARNKPLKDFEEILLFTPGKIGHARKPDGPKIGTTANRATYNPWRAKEVLKVNNPRRNVRATYQKKNRVYPDRNTRMGLIECPRSTLEYPKERVPAGGNPYRKPVALLDDLIRMYSNAGDVVLDNCAGSGSTAVAAIGAGRQWIAIEQNDDCFAEAAGRIDQALAA